VPGDHSVAGAPPRQAPSRPSGADRRRSRASRAPAATSPSSCWR
jgi:hypothetical protein